MFREELEIRHMLLNLILLAAFFGGTISLIISIVLKVHISSVLSMVLIIAVVAACLFISNKMNKPQIASLILVSLANIFIFPIMYFTSGGMYSGMPIWLVLGMILTWLLLTGKLCCIMYILNVGVVAACFVAEMTFPDFVIPMESQKAISLDVLQSIVVVTCIFGVIFKYQTYVYEKKKKELLDANRTKSEFLTRMSHEVRTPINAILGYNDMILKESRESQTVSYSTNIKTAGNTLLSLVDDIFNFTGLEDNRNQIKEVSQECITEKEIEFTASDARILAVDDNEMNLDILLGMLKETKMQIETRTNGLEALKALREKQYDLVLMDHMMPLMDGLDTLNNIKKEGLCEHTPVIVLTANAVGNVKEEYMQAGFDDYLSKPIMRGQLLALIQKYLPETVFDVQKEEACQDEGLSVLLDTELGMQYCCNNEDFYKEMIKSYLGNNKCQSIWQAYEDRDWEQYRILVHALKSTSLSIGAVSVSEKAKALETAVKENRTDYVIDNHEAVMAEYELLLKQLDRELNHPESGSEAVQPAADDAREHILVVDDDAMNLHIAKKILEESFIVTCVSSGIEALTFLQKEIPNLILLDLHMPQMDGFEVNSRLKKSADLSNIPVVFLTADHDRETEIKGFHEGALDFITKPFVADIMLQRIKRILELDRLQKNLQDEVEKQTKTAEARREKVERLSLQIMLTLANTIDAKDKYTNGHSIRVAEYAREIAKRAGKPAQEQEDIYFAGLLHDIGKIGIPNAIINKTSRLTDEEYAIIKSHPKIGAEILENMTEIPGLAVGAHWHHELYDGSGYPEGLKGTEIPETARIIGVADAYDAMASKRSYRDIMPQELVREELQKGRGSQFDPVFTDIILAMMDEDKEYHMHE